MVISAIPGPYVQFGLTRAASGNVQEYNEQRAPNVNDAGDSMMDPRAPYVYQPGSASNTKTWAWWDNYGSVDCKPGIISSVGISSAQQPVAGTALSLSTTSSGCITAGVTLIPASNPNTTVSVLAIDSTYATVPVGLACGQTGAITMWDPQIALSRAIVIEKSSATSDDSAGTYTIQGYDIYGYKMTETITGTSSTGSTSYVSQKAFKYIQSITPGGTIGATTVQVHPSPGLYGFPLAVRAGWQAEMWMGLSSNMVQVTTQSSLLVYGSTVTNTSTTPDVRGTWASTNLSSNSSNFVYIRVRPRPQDIYNMTTTVTTTGSWLWLGADQYSS